MEVGAAPHVISTTSYWLSGLSRSESAERADLLRVRSHGKTFGELLALRRHFPNTPPLLNDCAVLHNSILTL